MIVLIFPAIFKTNQHFPTSRKNSSKCRLNLCPFSYSCICFSYARNWKSVLRNNWQIPRSNGFLLFVYYCNASYTASILFIYVYTQMFLFICENVSVSCVYDIFHAQLSTLNHSVNITKAANVLLFWVRCVFRSLFWATVPLTRFTRWSHGWVTATHPLKPVAEIGDRVLLSGRTGLCWHCAKSDVPQCCRHIAWR